MQHDPGRSLIPQNLFDVGMRVAVVNHQRQAHLAGETHLRQERFDLVAAWGGLAIVVQPDLPDSDHPWMAGHLPKRFE